MTKSLTITDMGFLYAETVSRPNHVAALQIFDIPEYATKNYTDELYQALKQHKNIESPFNCRVSTNLTSGATWQQDDNVDLDYHLRHIMLPLPGNKQQLLEYVEQEHSNLLDRNRPLWEAHLITGLANNQFAMYVKMHHAFTDGAKANKIMQSYLAKNPQAELLPFWSIVQTKPRRNQTSSSITDKLLKQSASIRENISAIPAILGLSSKLILQGAKVYSSSIPTPFTAAKTPFSISPQRARRAATSQISLTRSKNISKLTGTTINDVIVCVCDIALHRYLSESHCQLDQPLKAQMPISLRDESDSLSNNRIAIMMVELAQSNAAPLARLMAIKDSCSKLKKAAQQLPDQALTSYSLASQGLAIMSEILQLDSVLPPVGNVLISNVPGPKNALYLKGAKLRECYPLSVLPPGISLNITLYSYLDQINVGLIACRTSLPDLANIGHYIHDAFIELETAVMNNAIDSVSEQLAQLSLGNNIHKNMHNIIEVINNSACHELRQNVSEDSTENSDVIVGIEDKKIKDIA